MSAMPMFTYSASRHFLVTEDDDPSYPVKTLSALEIYKLPESLSEVSWRHN